MPLIGGSFAAMNGQSCFGFTRRTVVFLTHFVLRATASCFGVDTFLPHSLSAIYRLQLSTVNTVDLCRYSCYLTVWSASEVVQQCQ